MNKYIYSLRICISPGFYEEEKIALLKEFCRQAKIDDVILHMNCEEINTGHATPEEIEEWLGVAGRVAAELKNMNITTSLNPWTTILHSDRGRVLKPMQNWRLMVDTEGREATAVVCPLDDKWQEYIIQAYESYASIKPNVLWLEDDFRFHNHAPLKWGGCFCDEHMKLISKIYGQQVNREELIELITTSGEPHPLRKLWLDLNRDTLVNLAAKIYKAVKNVSPSTRIGLMTSFPAVHCVEGRDWMGLVNSLGGSAECIIRPHVGYNEHGPGRLIWTFTIGKQTAALLDDCVDVHPELENGPWSRFTRSASTTRLQISFLMALCSTGITMNLFGMMGNGPVFEEGYQDILSEIKPFLNYVHNLELQRSSLNGIKVPFSSNSSYTIDTLARYVPQNSGGYSINENPGSSIEKLYPDEGKWDSMLSSFGFSTNPAADKELCGEIIAVSGQYFRNLSAEKIQKLFDDNFVILDGSAALTLFDMGFGQFAGIKTVKEIVPVNSGKVSYEEVCDGTQLLGMKQARLFGQVACGDAILLEYESETEVVSELKDFNGNTSGAGVAIYQGKCMVFPYNFPDSSDTWHLHTMRKEMLQELLMRTPLSRDKVSVCLDGAYVMLFSFGKPKPNLLLFANVSADDVKQPRIYVGSLGDSKVEAEVCDNYGKISNHTLIFNDGVCRLPFDLKSFEVIAVKL